MKESLLSKSLKILLFLFLLSVVLVKGKPLLAPIAFAGLFSMLMLPLAMKLENKGLSRGLSVLISELVLILVVAIIVGLVAWQVSDLSKNADSIEKNVQEKLQQLRSFITSSFGISAEKQDEIMKKQQQSADSRISSFVTGALSSAGTVLTNLLLVTVYIFLFLYFRTHLKKFIQKVVPRAQLANAEVIMSDGRKVAQKYLTGMALMIISLWIMYSIGFSIVGVKHAVFFAILCGLLEIVPFVGNLAGNAITVFMTLAQGGSMNMVIGILVVYGLVQFIQSYFLEPLVVGKEVNIHPVFTIIGIVAGEFIWGISGMILAIPVLGIIKIFCDHIGPLKPYGYLIGEEKTSEKGLAARIRKWVGK